MGFPKRNEGFICLLCDEENPPAPKTSRDHCRKCLWSVHVDETLPGDRLSTCMGKMRPLSIEPSSKKGWIILHQCEKCGYQKKNKAAEDDSFEEILRIAALSAERRIRGQC